MTGAMKSWLLMTGLVIGALVIGAFAQEKVPGLVLIPAGTFEMGDHHGFVDPGHGSDEIPVHAVRLDAFYMGVTDVTTREYCEFLNASLALKQIAVRDGGVYLAEGSDLLIETRGLSPYSRIGWNGQAFTVLDGKENHPVVCIRWAGAAAYCNWLSARMNAPAVYDTAAWLTDFNKSGYRLPTEAEWEYAAGGGQQSPYRRFPWGDDADAERANWPESRNPFRAGPQPWTTPVGFFDGTLQRRASAGWPGGLASFQTADGANGFGLHDMSGNVWQFVNDWYDRDYYTYSPVENPPGPERGSVMPDGMPYRGMRGGSWYNGANGHGRVSNRNPSYYRGPQDPNHPYYHVGFRVVLPVAAETRPVIRPTPVRRAPQPGDGRRPPPPAGGRGGARGEDQRGRGGRGGPLMAESKLPVSPKPGQTVGLYLNTPRAFDGYTLLAPKHNTVTYLIDNQGRIVNQWTSHYEPGQSAYLLPNGHLLRAGMVRVPGGTGGGEGGRIEEFDWDGRLVWAFDHATRDYQLHHDIKPMPNGHVLALMVERKSRDEAVAAGFDPDQLQEDYLVPDAVVEIEPTPPAGGRIVWEWHVWDHLVRGASPAEHPELVDPRGTGRNVRAFWNHMNSLDYNPALDQIVLSVRGNNEIWIIDHSTTTTEAAGHTGGRSGRGGDLLYRWGNPAAYRRGSASDRKLIQQHDARWIPDGSPGAGHITIFNNGYERGWSSVEEIVPPVDADGRYSAAPGKAYGPERPVWHYEATNRPDFFASEISGAHRLPNGNTLVCAGVVGNLFEVTPAGETVWQYINPVVRGGILAQGEVPGKDVRGHLFNAVFKAHRYAPEYPGLRGRDLSPTGVIELPASQKGKTGLDTAEAPPDGGRGGRGRGWLTP